MQRLLIVFGAFFLQLLVKKVVYAGLHFFPLEKQYQETDLRRKIGDDNRTHLTLRLVLRSYETVVKKCFILGS